MQKPVPTVATLRGIRTAPTTGHLVAVGVGGTVVVGKPTILPGTKVLTSVKNSALKRHHYQAQTNETVDRYVDQELEIEVRRAINEKLYVNQRYGKTPIHKGGPVNKPIRG